MTIIRKTEVAIHIDKFEKSYQELRQVLGGDEPNLNIWDQYSLNPDDYKRDFTEINLTKLNYAVGSFKAALVELAKLKTHKEPRRASNK